MRLDQEKQQISHFRAWTKTLFGIFARKWLCLISSCCPQSFYYLCHCFGLTLKFQWDLLDAVYLMLASYLKTIKYTIKCIMYITNSCLPAVSGCIFSLSITTVYCINVDVFFPVYTVVSLVWSLCTPCVIVLSLYNLCQYSMCCESMLVVNTSAPESWRRTAAHQQRASENHSHYCSSVQHAV